MRDLGRHLRRPFEDRLEALERWHDDHPIERILEEPECAADPLLVRWRPPPAGGQVVYLQPARDRELLEEWIRGVHR